MTSFRNALSQKIINPDKLIKEAETNASRADRVYRDTVEKESAPRKFEFDETDEHLDVTKKASKLTQAIDSFLESDDDESAENASKTASKTSQSSRSTSPEKSAAARLLFSGIMDDSLREIAEKRASGGAEVTLDDDTIEALNEKAAASLPGVLKGLGKAVLVGGAGAAGGYALGKNRGTRDLREGMRHYIQQDMAEDQMREAAIAQQAAQHGYNAALQKLRSSVQKSKDNTTGSQS